MFLLDHLMTKWLDHKRLQVDVQRCVRTRNRFSSCNRCESACPVSAIKLGNGLKVEQSKCTECMKCTVSCPTQVFKDEKYPSYFSDMVNREVISFSCEKNKKPGSHIQLACLAQLDIPLLLHALQHSSRVTIQLEDSTCKKCSKYDNSLQPFILKMIQQCNSMLKEPKEISFNEMATSQMERSYSRRDLISSFSKRMTTNIVTPILPEEDNKLNLRSSIHRGVRSSIFHQLLCKYQPKLKEIQKVQNVNSLHLAFTEHCDGCQLCSKICPTGSLQFREHEDLTLVEFYQWDCNGCYSCVDICRKNGITEGQESLSLQNFVQKEAEILWTFHHKICKRCGEKHLLQKDLCEDCEMGQKMFT